MENKLQQIYTDAGYDIKTDNRSLYTKSINNALAHEGVVLRLSKAGKVFVSEKGFRHNMEITINGLCIKRKRENEDPETICDFFASVLLREDVKAGFKIHENATICNKCQGKGIIPHFMHVSQGVCFDCMGIGYRFKDGNWNDTKHH